MRPWKVLSGSLAVAAAFLAGSVGPAAATVPVLEFKGQKLSIYSSPGVLDEVFILDLTTEATPTTSTIAPYTNPGLVTPLLPSPPGGNSPSNASPLLTAPGYTFTGYKIIGISGKAYDAVGTLTGEINFDPLNGSSAETQGVFNYEDPANPGVYPVDLISHSLPDNLWNPGGVGMGFAVQPGLPASALDNNVSFGGIAFDVFAPGTTDFSNPSAFLEPYQLFTVSESPTSGLFTSLVPGDVAGCPGSCRGARISKVPGPLPILGVGAAFGFGRRLRRRSALAAAASRS